MPSFYFTTNHARFIHEYNLVLIVNKKLGNFLLVIYLYLEGFTEIKFFRGTPSLMIYKEYLEKKEA